MMTYQEAIEFLFGLRFFGSKLGLENTRELARLCGNPQNQLRFIHVAGTNGKGSTCAMLESIYRVAGLKTGLFTSPHLISFSERIQVNRAPIAGSDVARLTEALIQKLGGNNSEKWELRPTFFEFVTVIALSYFAEQQCEIVIWETGLGGRLDATNIVTPLASVITNIQHDHERWLGNSLAEIAAEKAGIIKPGVPVITATAPGEALDVIVAKAGREGAPLRHVRSSETVEGIRLPLIGEHQRVNAATALAAVLAAGIPVPEAVMRRGLEEVRWAGRLQLVRHGASEVLLDGAHNPDGARALAVALEQSFAGRPFTLVFGLFRDKAWEEMCRVLCPLAVRVLLVPLQSERSVDPEQVREFCARIWPGTRFEACANVAAALERAVQDQFVVVAGSLHLVGEAMEWLHVAPGLKSERELNEWNAGRSDDSRPRARDQ